MKKITFIGFSADNIVEVIHEKEGQADRSCGANEVPFPVFLLESQSEGNGIRVQPVFDDGMSSFAIGMLKPHTAFPGENMLEGDVKDWFFEFHPAGNGKAVNLDIYCPEDTTLEWLKDPA